MTLQYWYMLPIGVVVATVAMASGVGGATLFAPIYVLALRLPPEVAVGIGLITQTFGFASGVAAYVRRRLIDYKMGWSILVVTIPLALLGSWLAGRFNPNLLKAILALGLLALGFSFLRRRPPPPPAPCQEAGGEAAGPANPQQTRLITAEGEEICYTTCDNREGRVLTGLGALFLGLISVGLGEMTVYFFLQRCKVPGKVAVATSIFLVAVTSLFASLGHLARFVGAGGDTLRQVVSLAIFTVPGVVLGAQIGPHVTQRLPKAGLTTTLGVLFILVAGLTLRQILPK